MINPESALNSNETKTLKVREAPFMVLEKPKPVELIFYIWEAETKILSITGRKKII